MRTVDEPMYYVSADILQFSFTSHVEYGIDCHRPALKVIPDDEKPEKDPAKLGSIAVCNHENFTFLMADTFYASKNNPGSEG